MGAYRVSATRAAREFSELLRRTGDGGQEVLIERYRKPVARLLPAGLSPVRWIDLVRQARRWNAPDTGFFPDLLIARGGRGRRPSAEPSGQAVGAAPIAGTVLLDTPLLLELNRQRFALPNLQRIATTSAAIAELASLAGRRGEGIRLGRLAYVRRVANTLPVVSLDHSAALEMHLTSALTAQGMLQALSAATARSLDWPLVGGALDLSVGAG
jgi:predicted nucleic acid-binding protein/antitoxin (DNA-binding transcriptional repressor) of toxin-antitoxin stability system